MEIERVSEILSELGRRLRAARIERNDTMDVFAQRLGVSVGTVRAMERGSSGRFHMKPGVELRIDKGRIHAK